MMWKVLGNILCNRDPKSRSKGNCILVKCKHTIILIVFCVQDVMTDVTADSDVQAHQELHCLSISLSVKNAHPKNDFLILNQNICCMMWVLKRNVSMRRFF